MLTITLCFALVSLVALGLFILITLGLANVEMIRKKNIRINKISFSGPVSTSVFSFVYFFLMLIVKFVTNRSTCWFLENISKFCTGNFHFIFYPVNLGCKITMAYIR